MSPQHIHDLEEGLRLFRNRYPPAFYNNRKLTSISSPKWFIYNRPGMSEYIENNFPHISVEKIAEKINALQYKNY